MPRTYYLREIEGQWSVMQKSWPFSLWNEYSRQQQQHDWGREVYDPESSLPLLAQLHQTHQRQPRCQIPLCCFEGKGLHLGSTCSFHPNPSRKGDRGNPPSLLYRQKRGAPRDTAQLIALLL